MSGRLHAEHKYMNTHRVHYYNHNSTRPPTPTSPVVHPHSLQISLTLLLIHSENTRQPLFLVSGCIKCVAELPV